MNIAQNTVVTMHYTVSTTDGTEIDSSRSGEPMMHLQGSQYLIKGLEDSLLGKTVGDKYEIEVSPENAYGERHEQLVQTVPKTLFGDNEVNVGMTFRAQTDDGEQTVMVIDATEEEVVVDGNHPLAGVELKFDVEILDVRAATDEEIAHGHAHAPGGCGHDH
ncbi:FKBP-type peptidyl-prolyl cis-trans isomerase [Opacimonas viscosa]|uniref:Peptidyl-prolyl cis-trans isomerase n=1 Tax=Opacimonas viscosa TaxID=2961944 RepID=A0AA41X308_9ALTE|nr:peptidylprolyl isomerase [Opacimonas viscosa]MCP3428942.1 peptidylprolyl isomerase [Opacimonas viscosa]